MHFAHSTETCLPQNPIHTRPIRSPSEKRANAPNAIPGWMEALIVWRKRHEHIRYPLKGKHVSVECAKCHLPAGKDTIYKVKFALCTDCHKDAHDSQFAAAPHLNKCEDCHTVRDFHRALFTITQHSQHRFALAGAHAAVPCADCHKVERRAARTKLCRSASKIAVAPPATQIRTTANFKDRMAQRRADGTPLGCEAVHNVRSWADINGFDHSKTKFLLLGAHRAVKLRRLSQSACGPKSGAVQGQRRRLVKIATKTPTRPNLRKAVRLRARIATIRSAGAPSTFNHDTRNTFSASGRARQSCL